MQNWFSSLGLCISTNRVNEIQSAITQDVCQQYRFNKIDHNKTFSISSSHFHGTSIEKKEILSYRYTIMILVLLVELIVNSRFLQLMNIPKLSVNPAHDSLEWVEFVDDTSLTNAKASEK